MIRLVVIIVIAVVIVIAGLIIFVVSWSPDPVSISQDGNSDEGTALASPVMVSINAIPWARVFIKLPERDYFMEPRAQHFSMPPEPRGKNYNITPIPGDLKVPIGTTIKLIYRGREKIFPYEAWKDGNTISHDFLNQ